MSRHLANKFEFFTVIYRFEFVCESELQGMQIRNVYACYVFWVDVLVSLTPTFSCVLSLSSSMGSMWMWMVGNSTRKQTENTVVKQKWQTTCQIIPQSDDKRQQQQQLYTNKTSCWLDVNANDKVWFLGNRSVGKHWACWFCLQYKAIRVR